MKFKLESTNPSLDWDVEKDGAREIRYDKDSYDYLFGDGELVKYSKEQQDMIDEDDKAILDAIAEGLAESEMSDEELMALWDKNDLGKSTINTTTIEKQKEAISARGMEIFDEQEFQEALDDFSRTVNNGDPIKEEINAEIDRIMQQMELDW